MDINALDKAYTNSDNSTVEFLLERLSKNLGPDVIVKIGNGRPASADSRDVVILYPTSDDVRFRMSEELTRVDSGEQLVAEIEFRFTLISRAAMHKHKDPGGSFLANRRLLRRVIAALAQDRLCAGKLTDVFKDTAARWVSIDDGSAWQAETAFVGRYRDSISRPGSDRVGG